VRRAFLASCLRAVYLDRGKGKRNIPRRSKHWEGKGKWSKKKRGGVKYRDRERTAGDNGSRLSLTGERGKGKTAERRSRKKTNKKTYDGEQGGARTSASFGG